MFIYKKSPSPLADAVPSNDMTVNSIAQKLVCSGRFTVLGNIGQPI